MDCGRGDEDLTRRAAVGGSGWAWSVEESHGERRVRSDGTEAEGWAAGWPILTLLHPPRDVLG